MRESDDDSEVPEVQVYHFDSGLGSWEDHGCGLVTVIAGVEPFLQVADGSNILMKEPITPDTTYTIEGECGITFWSKVDNIEKALSFDQDFLCQRVRERIAIVAHTKTPKLPTTLTCESLKDIAGLIEQLKASLPTLSSWVMRSGMVDQLLGFFHWIGVLDPLVQNEALHTTVHLIESMLATVLQAGSTKILASVTADVNLWSHYLMLLDYILVTTSSPPSFTSTQLPAEFTGQVSPELLEGKPPWDDSVMSKWMHTRSFGSGVAHHKIVGKFKSKEVLSRIYQTGRADYWINHIIIPASVNSVPIPSAQNCIAAGGDWEECIVAMKEMVQQNQIVLVSLIIKDSVFVTQLFKSLATKCDANATRYSFLNELFHLGEASFLQGVDLCTELSRFGLFLALFKGLDNGDVEAAKLLEYSVGGGPHPCTSGDALKLCLAGAPDAKGGSETKPELFLILAKSVVAYPAPPETSEHVIDVLDKLLTANYAKLDATGAPPVTAISDLDSTILNCIVKFALPYILKKLTKASVDQIYNVTSLLGRHLERESVEICEVESQWRILVKKEIATYLITSGVMDLKSGCLAQLMQTHARCPHLLATIIRLHRCIISLSNSNLIRRYASGQYFTPVVDLFLQGNMRNSLLTSAILGAFFAMKAHPVCCKELFGAASHTLFDAGLCERFPVLKEILAEVSEEDKEVAEKNHRKIVARQAEEMPEEIEKARLALATLDTFRVKLLSHYMALCEASGSKPTPPHTELSGKPSIMPVATYSEVYSKIDHLTNAKTPPEKLLECPAKRHKSESKQGTSPLLRKDSLMFASRKHRDKTTTAQKSVTEGGDETGGHHPQPPRRKNSFGRYARPAVQGSVS